jgi:hypothetical protein
MKVKIGDKIYCATEQPIMIIFENKTERKGVANQILNMPDDSNNRYCMHPISWCKDNHKKLMKWMSKP